MARPTTGLLRRSVISLYIDDPAVAAEAVRPTEDIDVLICVSGEQQPADAEQALRSNGWRDDIRPHRKNAQAFISPGGIPVDVVFNRLQPESDWIVRAARSPDVIQLGDHTIAVPSPAYLVVSKLAAAENADRWENAYSSHDLADALTVLFGCARVVESLQEAPEDVREYVAKWARHAREHPADRIYQALLADMPRAFSEADLDNLLDELASLASGSSG